MQPIIERFRHSVWMAFLGPFKVDLSQLPVTVVLKTGPNVRRLVALAFLATAVLSLTGFYYIFSLPTLTALTSLAVLLTPVGLMYALLRAVQEERRVRFDRWQVIVTDFRAKEEHLWRELYASYEGVRLKTWSQGGVAFDVLELTHQDVEKTIPLQIAPYGSIQVNDVRAVAERLNVPFRVEPENLPKPANTAPGTTATRA